MLKSIYCDKFKQPLIKMNDNINVVLGDNNASNSIGKSTLLMIIDFVFGGDDYAEKCDDIVENIKHHSIYSHFLFETDYYFMRNTKEYNYIFICDKNKKIVEPLPWSIEEFRVFLHKKYNITDYITFRNFIGRYSRVYGKDNLNNSKPLNIVQNERTGLPLLSLIKIFNEYDKISEQESKYNLSSNNYSVFKAAIKKDYIKNITKKIFNDNINKIKVNEEKMQTLLSEMNANTSDSEQILSDEIINLRNSKRLIIDEIEKLEGKINKTNYNLSNRKSNLYAVRDQLCLFFPNVNIDRLSEIENFHSGLAKILKNELMEYKKNLEIQKDYLSKQKLEIEMQIEKLVPKENLKNINEQILELYSKLKLDNDSMSKENKIYSKLSALNAENDESEANLNKIKEEVLNEIISKVNKQLIYINDIITENVKKEPSLILDGNTYELKMIDDKGTGSAYRGLLVFDLAIMSLTNLPLIIHDSLLFKNIETDFLENILNLYNSFNRQVFISIDEIIKYKKETQKTLVSNKIISLSKGKEALFGFTWNDKEPQEETNLSL